MTHPTYRTIAVHFFLIVLLVQPTVASRIHSTLYQELKGAKLVLVVTAFNRNVDSLATIFHFHIDQYLQGTAADSDVSVITFVGKNVMIAEEERFTIGVRYLLLLYHPPHVMQWDSVRDAIYQTRNAYYTIRSFPHPGEDFETAVGAVKTLLPLLSMRDAHQRVARVCSLLTSKNDYIVESAIEEVREAGAKESIPELRRVAVEGGTMARFLALDALRSLNGAKEAPTFYTALHDPSAMVRQRGLSNLFWSDTPVPEDTLINIAQDTTEQLDNRFLAMHGLLRTPSPRPIPVLQHLLDSHPNDPVFGERVTRILDALKTSLNSEKKKSG